MKMTSKFIIALSLALAACGSSIAAEQTWVVDRPGSGESRPCRAATAFSDLGGGNVAFLSQITIRRPAQTFAVALHSTNAALPKDGSVVDGVLQIDRSDLISMELTLTVLDNATALIATLPNNELLELLKKGHSLRLLLSGVGQIDIGLQGSRKALEQWERCIATEIAALPRPTTKIQSARPWIGIWAEKKSWCAREVGLDGGPIELTEASYSALDAGCEIRSILEGGDKVGLLMLCQREDLKSTELHTVRVVNDILSMDDEQLFFRC